MNLRNLSKTPLSLSLLQGVAVVCSVISVTLVIIRMKQAKRFAKNVTKVCTYPHLFHGHPLKLFLFG